MASKYYASGDPEVQKLWSKRLAHEGLKRTVLAQYFKDSGDALGTIETNPQKEAGDNVTITLRMQLTGDGVTETENMEGNEEAISTNTTSVTIGELGHSTKSKTRLTQQRVPFKIAKEMNDALADWYADRTDFIGFAHLCGFTPANTWHGQTLGKFNGFNTVTAPSAGRFLHSGTAHTTDETLAAGDEFKLTDVDKCVELAQTGGSTGLIPIRPIKGLPGGADYLCFVNPSQTTSLRASAATAGGWMDLQKALLQGGEGEKSAIWKGGLGVFNKTFFVESTRVTPGVNSTTGVAVTGTRRAVFCGAQALGLAYGQGYGPDEWKWEEETFDYKRHLGVSCLNLFGIKKTVFASSDFATIVVSSYAPDAA